MNIAHVNPLNAYSTCFVHDADYYQPCTGGCRLYSLTHIATAGELCLDQLLK